MHTQFGYGDPETWGPVCGPNDPRWEDDDDALALERALDDCQDELLVTPSAVALFLHEECEAFKEPVNVVELGEDLAGLPAAKLLAIVIGSLHEQQTRLALHELRAQILATYRHDLEQAAHQRVKEQ